LKEESDPFDFFQKEEENDPFSENNNNMEEKTTPILFSDFLQEKPKRNLFESSLGPNQFRDKTVISNCTDSGNEDDRGPSQEDLHFGKFKKYEVCPSEDSGFKTQKTLTRQFKHFPTTRTSPPHDMSSKDLLKLKRQYYSNFNYKAYIEDYMKNLGME
jgi:hypothetical protein